MKNPLRAGCARDWPANLDYMQRTESLRRDPRELVPWAISVISVGMNYYSAYPRAGRFFGATRMDLALRLGRRLSRRHEGQAGGAA